MKCIEIIVSGRVQGVGFRWYALEKAKILHITGYVKNERSGQVKILACGEADMLEIFTDWMRQGPSYALIDRCETSEVTVFTPYEDFNVKY